MEEYQVSQKEKNTILIFFLLCIATYNIGLKIMSMLSFQISNQATSRLMEVITLSLLFIFVKFSSLKIERTGFCATAVEIKRTLIRCGIISLGIIIVFFITRLVMNHFSPVAAARPWFGLYLHIHTRSVYLFIVILQEFLAKGIMQENMKKLMGNDNKFLPILACSFIFTILHIGYPLYYMISAGLMTFVTGYIYEKDHSIWGCVLIHFCLGFLPRAMGLK